MEWTHPCSTTLRALYITLHSGGGGEAGQTWIIYMWRMWKFYPVTFWPFYPFTFSSLTLLPFYPFTLLVFYAFTLLRFYAFTLLSFYPFTLLRFFPFTLLRFYASFLFTLLRFYSFALLRFYPFTLLLFYALPFYAFTLVSFYPFTLLPRAVVSRKHRKQTHPGAWSSGRGDWLIELWGVNMTIWRRKNGERKQPTTLLHRDSLLTAWSSYMGLFTKQEQAIFVNNIFYMCEALSLQGECFM